MFLLIFIGLTGLLSGFFFFSFFGYSSWKEDLREHLAYRNLERISRQVPYVDCEDFSGTPREVFERLAERFNLPKEALIVLLSAESSGNPYAVSCDVCKSCGGLTSDRWKSNLSVLSYKSWVLENRSLLDPYMSKGGNYVNCSLPPNCWCNLGFGLMQIAAFNLPYPAPDVSPNPPFYEEEPPESPFNLCTNLYYGFSIYRKCVERTGSYEDALCCYNGTSPRRYLRHLISSSEKLGKEPSLINRIFAFGEEILLSARSWFFSVLGKNPCGVSP